MENIEHKLSVLRDIIVAYVSRNHVPTSEIDSLIRDVYLALADSAADQSTAGERSSIPTVVGQSSTMTVRASIQPEGIVSFINGRTYKTLKRHLTAHGLTPETYRQRFGLNKDYPMVAPNYAAKRAAIARRVGLGRPGFMAVLASETLDAEPQSNRRRSKGEQ